jgi:hypothetical protein
VYVRNRKEGSGKWKKFYDEILIFVLQRYGNKEVKGSMRFRTRSTHEVCKYPFRILETKSEGIRPCRKSKHRLEVNLVADVVQ